MEQATPTTACAACGQEIPREAHFCMHCGKPVAPWADSTFEVRKVVSVRDS